MNKAFQDLINTELLSTLLEVLHINFFAINKNGFYICKNSLLTRIVGDREDADKVDHKAWQSCLEVIKTRERQVLEEEYQGRWYLSVKSPLIREDEVLGVVGISTDITERKQAELAKNEFLANMSHDLRTPFSGLYALTEHLQEQEQDPDKKEILGYISTSAKGLLALLNEVLELARLGSNPVKYTDFNIADTVNEVLTIMKSEVKNKQLALNLECPNEMIYNDKYRVTRILLNLVSNALKYTEKGSVSILVKTKPNLQIIVKDTGPGIPEECFNKIFEKFTKLKPSYEQAQFAGAGLGLYITRQLAHEIGGEILVSSKLGIGSKFTFQVKKPLTLNQAI